MSRDLTAINPPDQPFGTPAAVRRAIEDALPGVQFYREPSGAEKLAAADARRIECPAVLREHFQATPATLQADYEGADCSIRFRLGAVGQDRVATIALECRGAGDLFDLLERLVEATGWSLDGRAVRFDPWP